MKAAKLISTLLILFFIISCGSKDNRTISKLKDGTFDLSTADIALNRGFTEYISAYTSGIIQANSSIEIHFTPEFASRINKSSSGLFDFEPALKGKTEWKDETTLRYIPSKLLDPGKIYTGRLNLGKLSQVKENLRFFPLRIQTLRKDFRVSYGTLECSSSEGNSYLLHGEIITSDYIEPREVENYLTAILERKNLNLAWDHSVNLTHKFTIGGIERTNKAQVLILAWDGRSAGVKQKGSFSFRIPASGDFSIIDIITTHAVSQQIDIIFSDPVDGSKEIEGLIHFLPSTETTMNINSNIISIFPSTKMSGSVDMSIESSIRNTKGATLGSSFLKHLDFTAVPPGIMADGKGVIIPSSINLIFPFKAVNLKSADLKIIRIFDNNLPYFLQENDINGDNSLKRFGRPVYSGKIDLLKGSSINSGAWNLYTIDLADYIDVEPGVLYKVSLGMRRSYSLYSCNDSAGNNRYDELLKASEENNRKSWDDPESTPSRC